jgi:hypothetical protein
VEEINASGKHAEKTASEKGITSDKSDQEEEIEIIEEEYDLLEEVFQLKKQKSKKEEEEAKIKAAKKDDSSYEIIDASGVSKGAGDAVAVQPAE